MEQFLGFRDGLLSMLDFVKLLSAVLQNFDFLSTSVSIVKKRLNFRIMKLTFSDCCKFSFIFD